MKNQYTLYSLFKNGYCLSDIDAIVRHNLATYSTRNGRTALVIPDKVSADNFVSDRRDRESWRRR